MKTNHAHSRNTDSFPSLASMAAAIVWCVLILAGLSVGTSSMQGAVTVTVDRSTAIDTSSYFSAMSQIDNSLDFPWTGNNGAAVTNARTLMAQGVSFGNNHIMAWGVSDPWPSPTSPNPTNWGGMDTHMNLIINAGCTPIITLCEAPWWMKGQYQSAGTTKLIPDSKGEWASYTYTNGITDYRGQVFPTNYVSPDPFAARVLDCQMTNWLLLVQRTAERYMVAPYNVRYFQVWNELKGYFNGTLNRWEYDNFAGNTNGYNAQHGYTYLYNQTYSRLTNVAATLGIPASNVYIGGPYVVMDSGSASNVMSNPSGVKGPWGIIDKRDLDVIGYWLTNKLGAGFVCVDGGNNNKYGTDIADQFTRCGKFSTVNNWIRQQPGGTTLPIVWSEWYNHSDDPSNQSMNNALGAYAATQQILSGAFLTLLWGGEVSGAAEPPMWTDTSGVGGGQALPWFYTYQALDQKFGSGTTLYQTTSSSTNVGVLASAAYTLLINTTSNSTSVTLDGTGITLSNYEVRVVSVPPTAPSGLTATTMSSNQVNLAWTDNANNETGFKIERKTGSGGTYAQIATNGPNSTSYVDTTLTANTTYYYRVRATNPAGDSAYSNEANATTLPVPPAAPSGLGAAAVSPNEIDLAWTDNASNETGFKIERKTGSGGTYAQIATAGVNVTSYSDTNLTENTTYYYRVRATNTGGDSAYSNEANATTPIPIPAAPSNLIVTGVSTSQVNLSWTDNATNESSFKIERKTGPGGTYSQIGTTVANVTTYTDNAVATGTLYYYRVRASNSGGDSAYSAEVSGGTDAVVRNTVSAPIIDGNVDSNWLLAPTYPFNNVTLGTVSSTNDLSGVYQVLWDTTNLYLLVTVVDDVKTNDSGMARFDDDGLEIYIDAGNHKATNYDSTDYQYTARWNDTLLKESKHNATNGVSFAQVNTANGYRMEFKFPWATLGATPGAGTRIGFEVQVNDDDDGGTRDGKMAWWNTSDTAYQNPATFGTAQLGPVDIAPSVSITTPVNSDVLNTGNITVTATASDSDGSVSKVDFYQGSTLIGTATTSPYTITWTGVTAGSYSLTAKATDDSGAVTTSSAVNITVTTDALIQFTSTPPVIDGSLDSIWSSAKAYSFTNIILGVISSTNDLSGTFQAMWDNTNFYLLVTVVDDVRTNDSGTSTWDDDGLEIYVDATNSKTTNYTTGDYQYTLRWNDTVLHETKHNATNGVVYAQANTSNGYRMEFKYPWATLGTTPGVGVQIGLEVQVNDDDDGGTRDGKMAWWGTSDIAYQNPSAFGTARMK